jgi:hypothetical protein
MASVSKNFEFKVEWQPAPGVATPELAATWARYEIWLGDRCVTQVEAADGTFRRGVYGSLYPLAYWIASNWWLLTSHVRPTAVEARYWTWRNVQTYPWLRQHNVRGAGDGMAWPDLTLVPEGAVTRVHWFQDPHKGLGAVRFASDGSGLVRFDEFRAHLAKIVNNVLDRLTEVQLTKTPLAEEWASIANSDDEEVSFCETTARLGLDPYSVSDATAGQIINVASVIPVEIAGDFFDSADANDLINALEWTQRAIREAEMVAIKASRSLLDIPGAIAEQVATFRNALDEPPWELGYAMARALRGELGVADTEVFDIGPWVGAADVQASARGLDGFAAVSGHRCGVVLGTLSRRAETRRFGQARALGRILVHPEQRQFILSVARSHDDRVARAFAAELLAPAQGIRRMLDTAGEADDTALEAVADRYNVSPLVVRHQYENQIAA